MGQGCVPRTTRPYAPAEGLLTGCWVGERQAEWGGGGGRKGWLHSPSLVHLLQPTRPHGRPGTILGRQRALPRFAEGCGPSRAGGRTRREAGRPLQPSVREDGGCRGQDWSYLEEGPRPLLGAPPTPLSPTPGSTHGSLSLCRVTPGGHNPLPGFWVPLPTRHSGCPGPTRDKDPLRVHLGAPSQALRDSHFP